MFETISKWLDDLVDSLALSVFTHRPQDGERHATVTLGFMRFVFEFQFGIVTSNRSVRLFGLLDRHVNIGDFGFVTCRVAQFELSLGGGVYPFAEEELWPSGSNAASTQNSNPWADEEVITDDPMTSADAQHDPDELVASANGFLSTCFRYELKDPNAREITWYADCDDIDQTPVATGYSGSIGCEVIVRFPNGGEEVKFVGFAAWLLLEAGTLVSSDLNYTPEPVD